MKGSHLEKNLPPPVWYVPPWIMNYDFIMCHSVGYKYMYIAPRVPSNFKNLQFKVQVLATLLNESQRDDFIYHFGNLEQIHIQFQNPLVPISHFAPFMTNPACGFCWQSIVARIQCYRQGIPQKRKFDDQCSLAISGKLPEINLKTTNEFAEFHTNHCWIRRQFWPHISLSSNLNTMQPKCTNL